MIQIGVRSTGWRARARSRRSFFNGVVIGLYLRVIKDAIGPCLRPSQTAVATRLAPGLYSHWRKFSGCGSGGRRDPILMLSERPQDSFGQGVAFMRLLLGDE